MGKFRSNQNGFAGNGGGRQNRQSQREVSFTLYSFVVLVKLGRFGTRQVELLFSLVILRRNCFFLCIP